MKNLFTTLLLVVCLGSIGQPPPASPTVKDIIVKNRIQLGGVWRNTWPDSSGGTGSGWLIGGNTLGVSPGKFGSLDSAYIRFYAFNREALVLVPNGNKGVQVLSVIPADDSSNQAATTAWIRANILHRYYFQSPLTLDGDTVKCNSCGGGGGSGWGLTGNSSTDTNTNWVGTNDNVNLLVKRGGITQFNFYNDSILSYRDIVMVPDGPTGSASNSRITKYKSYSSAGLFQQAYIFLEGGGVANGSALTMKNFNGGLVFDANVAYYVFKTAGAAALLRAPDGFNLSTTSLSAGTKVGAAAKQTSGYYFKSYYISPFNNEINAQYTDNENRTSFGDSAVAPDPSAAVDIQSSSKGLLIPRLTQAARTAISSPATSLIVYQTDGTAGYYFYNGTAWVMVAAGGAGSGINYVIQTTAPTDTTVFWVDNNTGAKGVWPIKKRFLNSWCTIYWYDPIANFVSDKRPLYVICTGQSNALWRTAGGDLQPDPRVLYFATGGSWVIANPVAGNANNIGYQFAKQVAKRENRIVRFVVVAENAKPVEDWYPGGLKTVEIANLIREAGIDSFNVFLFRQGERNTELGNTEVEYGKKIDTVFTSYRDSSWFGKSCRIILGGLNESYENTGVFDYYNNLNNGNKSGVEYTAVNMLGLSRVSAVHIDGPSIDTVGRRYYEAYAGKTNQYSLEKTPNISWLTPNELSLRAYSNIPAILRWAYPNVGDRKGGYIKIDDVNAQMKFGWNGINNGTVANDSDVVFINGNYQLGIGKVNNTNTTNKSQLHLRTSMPIAFSIGSVLDNAKFQINNAGSMIKPLCFWNMYSRDGNIIFKHLTGDTANGLIRYTRSSFDSTINYRGFYSFFNGATNRYILGGHPTNDAIWWNDIPVLEIDEAATGVAIKLNANPTALLDIGVNTTARGQLRYRVGVDPTSPTQGTTWFTSNNLKISDGTTSFIFAKTLTNTATLDFDLSSVNFQDLTITVTGAADGDAGSIGIPSASVTSNVQFQYMGSTTNTVTIRASRIDVSSSANPASGTFRASVVKY